MKKPLINEREINQKMFQVMRNKRILREDFDPNDHGTPRGEGENPEAAPTEAPTEAPPQPEQEQEPPKKIQPSESDVAEAQENFRQVVAPDAIFTEYNIFPEERNVIFKGSIPGLGNWEFKYTQKDGFSFDTEAMVTMNSINFEIIKSLTNHFENWKGEMDSKLLEYDQGSNG